jgi:hypothetical protein
VQKGKGYLMKVSELREILRTIPDDVEICFELQTRIPDKELKKMIYPWPYNNHELIYAGYDCGYSERIIKIFVEEAESK